MYPATVLFRKCEHCVRTAAAAWLRCPLLLPSQPPIVLPATTADVGAAMAAWEHAPLHAASVAAMQRAVRPPPLLSAPRHRGGRLRGRHQGTYLSLPPPHRPQHCARTQHLSGGFAEGRRPPLGHPSRLPPAGRPPQEVGQACLIRSWYHGGGGGGAAIPVDWAAATAADGDEAYPYPFTDAEKAAAAAPAPASSSTEAPAAWRSPASVEAGIAVAPATGATIMLPPAEATSGRGVSDAAPSSPVTACQLSPLCGTAQRTARWSVAGEVAAAAAAISAAAEGDRMAALAGAGGGTAA